MSDRVLIAAAGLNPLRVLRAAWALRTTHLVLIVTPTASFAADAVRRAAQECGLPLRHVLPVCVDEWRLAKIHADLEAATTSMAAFGVTGLPDVLVAGGTKPIVLVCAQAAQAWSDDAHTWTMEDRTGTMFNLAGDRLAETVPPAHPSVSTFAALHNGLHTRANTGPPKNLGWLRDHLTAGTLDRGERPADLGLAFESALHDLLERLLPSEFRVHGSQVVTLRDPDKPSCAAVDLARSHVTGPAERVFEVDAVVIRGTRAWVVEAKYRSLKLQQAHVAFAELDRRRRDFGGDTTRGILIFLSDDIGDRLPEGPLPFTAAGVDVITNRDLLAALDHVDGCGNGQSELLRIFTG